MDRRRREIHRTGTFGAPHNRTAGLRGTRTVEFTTNAPLEPLLKEYRLVDDDGKAFRILADPPRGDFVKARIMGPGSERVRSG